MMIPLLLVGSLAVAPGAAVPCTALLGTPKAWVKDAEVIVRARAVEELKGAEAVGGFSTRVRFVALETLKGSEPRTPLLFVGTLVDWDDTNDTDGEKKWVRAAGRAGSCYAKHYKRGAEFLLLLKRGSDGALTPYWAPLGATNEQLFGSADRWLAWVRQQLSRK